jgi:hypothetical protein
VMSCGTMFISVRLIIEIVIEAKSDSGWAYLHIDGRHCVPDLKPLDGHEVTTGLRSIGEGERILTNAITQQFIISSSGALEPLTAGSTRPVASTVTHVGIARSIAMTWRSRIRTGFSAQSGRQRHRVSAFSGEADMQWAPRHAA